MRWSWRSSSSSSSPTTRSRSSRFCPDRALLRNGEEGQVFAVIADLPLGINVYNFVAQVIVFLIVLIVLARWVFPLLTKTLDQRAAVIREGVENAQKAQR